MIDRMSDVTQVLKRIDEGDPRAPELLLPLVYDELRRLAAGHMANESPGHTLDATALVHEAYLRLVAGPTQEAKNVQFANRGHFFAAAAEAMRRILVDSARRKRAEKRGGGRRAEIDIDAHASTPVDADSWIDLDAALTSFESVDADAARLAKLRIFGGLTNEEAGEALGVPRATAHRQWTYAKAWLTAALADQPGIP
jgi:RNA polymerase sigma factor (TIGR02999 family)